MTHTKQIAAVLAALLFCTAAAGCASKPDENKDTAASDTEAATTAPAEWKSGDIYTADGYAAELLFPMKENMLDHAAEKFRYICDTYLTSGQHEIRFAVIPDKSVFSAAEHGYPAIDYPAFVSYLRSKTDAYADFIDLKPLLSVDDYYRTDLHWKQESIQPVASAIAESFGLTLSADYTENTIEEPFKGGYLAKAPEAVEPDRLVYLTNDMLSACHVTSYNDGTPSDGVMYNLEKATGETAYDLFLSGADPLQIIENPNASSDRSLVIFRDSFSSSLTPLLAEAYASITLVDLRYIRSDMLKEYITFDDQDILFLYCTQVLNNSLILK